MRTRTKFAASIAPSLMLAGQLFAGGFWLQLGNPEASAEARKVNAVVTIKATGCHDPENAKVTATAIGMVNGRREVIPLKLIQLSEPGTFALSRQWPRDGKWVIELVGKNDNQFTNTLVSAGPEGIDRHKAKSNLRQFTAADVETMLESR